MNLNFFDFFVAKVLTLCHPYTILFITETAQRDRRLIMKTQFKVATKCLEIAQRRVIQINDYVERQASVPMDIKADYNAATIVADIMTATYDRIEGDKVRERYAEDVKLKTQILEMADQKQKRVNRLSKDILMHEEKIDTLKLEIAALIRVHDMI